MARVWFAQRLGAPPGQTDRKAGAPCGGGEGLRRAARGVLRSRRGAYAVEFAMLVPIVVGLLMGAVEVAWQYIASVALENAALTAARVGSLGRKNANGTRDGSACLSEVKTAAVQASAGVLTGARLTLTPTQYSKASQLAARTGGSTGTGVAGGFVEYRLVYEQPLLFFGRTAVFSGTSVRHEVRAAIMNEPYPNASNTTPCS